jgi:hypothetical protein
MLQTRKVSNPRVDHSSGGAQQPGGLIQMVVMDQQANANNANNNMANNNSNQAKNSLNTAQQPGLKNVVSGVYDDALNNPMNLEWIYKPFMQRIIRICGMISFVSICANTPETFNKYKHVKYATYASDVVTTLVFTIEMIAKIKIRGLFKGELAYIFDRWCQFDGIMVIFHIISVVLQVS